MRSAHLLGPVLAITALLAACGPSDNDPGPGGVTVGEARALDEAAQMIEERRIPADVLAEQDEAEQDGAEQDRAEQRTDEADTGQDKGQNTGEDE
ncbi:MAG: hypothetical protein VX454_08755 [Pseudomonadota bacterium]|nr:hypothetical protein [Pseudomonadota bacterium]